jgi:hypothetical protein
MITVVLPVFNSIAWVDPQPEAPLRSFKEMGALIALAAITCAAVLLDQPTLRALLGVISAASVLLMFCLIGSVGFLVATRFDNRITRWRDLLLPAMAGLAFAISVIGVIDLVRYLFTGTWEGFIMS